MHILTFRQIQGGAAEAAITARVRSRSPGREMVLAFGIDREGCVRQPTRSRQEFHFVVNQTGTLLKKADTLCTANYISHCPIPPGIAGMRPLAASTRTQITLLSPGYFASRDGGGEG